MARPATTCCRGSAGATTSRAIAANDTLQGGDGNDTLNGGLGNDALQGGPGDDRYLYAVGDGNDQIADDGGNDLLRIALTEYSHAFLERSGADGEDLTVNLTDGGSIVVAGQFAGAGGAIEAYDLGDGTTSHAIQHGLAGTAGADLIVGTQDADVIAGGGGLDILYGADGDDTVTGGSAADEIYGGTGDDLLMGSGGNDTYVYADHDGVDRVVDTGGNNALEFSGIGGGAFNGAIHIGDDLVIRLPDGGSVTIAGHYAGTPVTTGVDDMMHDVFYLATSSASTTTATVLAGTDAKDILTAFGQDDVLVGNGGDDILEGGGGHDTMTGGDGADTFYYRNSALSSTVPANGPHDPITRRRRDPRLPIRDRPHPGGVRGVRTYPRAHRVHPSRGTELLDHRRCL